MSIISPLMDHLRVLKEALAAHGAPGAALAPACRDLEAELGPLAAHIEFARLQLPGRRHDPKEEPGLHLLRSFAQDFRGRHKRTYLDAAELLASSGQEEAAVNLLAALLHSLPFDAAAHQILQGLAKGPAETARRAQALASSCRLEPLAVFGKQRITYPMGMALDEEGGLLYVSDHGTAVIHRFDLAGHGHSELYGPWTGLMGLCMGPHGLLWACDHAGRALYGLDAQGQVRRQIDWEGLLGESEPFRRPEYLCAANGVLYVQTCTLERNGARLWSLDPADPAATLRRFAELPLGFPAGVHAAGGRIFVAGAHPATIAILNAASGEATAMLHPPCREMYQIAGADDGLYITHTEAGLLKLGSDGRVLYSAPYARLLDEPCQAQGLAVGLNGGVKTLFLADGVGRCIRSFAV